MQSCLLFIEMTHSLYNVYLLQKAHASDERFYKRYTRQQFGAVAKAPETEQKINPAFKLTNDLVYRILNSEDIYGVPPIFQAQRAVLMSAMLSGENTTTS
jgi:hypothetical protein